MSVRAMGDAIARPIAAALLAAVFDGLMSRGLFLAGDGTLAAATSATGLAHAAAIGLALGLLNALGDRLGEGRGRFAIAPKTVILAFAAAAYFIFVNQKTFDGARARRLPHRELWIVLYNGIGVIAVVLSTVMLARAVGRLRDQAGRRRAAAAIAATFAAVLIAMNTRILPGTYPMFHAQLAAAALGALLFAACLIGAPPSRVLIAAAAIALIGGLSVRTTSMGRRAEAHMLRAFPAIGEWMPLTNPLFALVRRPEIRALSTDVPADDPVEIAAAAALLDRAAPDRGRMNVLFIAVDTLRADRCGFMGYSRRTTPHMDRLAESSVVFKRAYSAYPTSNYSYAAAFTGFAPRSTAPYAVATETESSYAPETTLASVLAARGRKTIGLSAFDRFGVRQPNFYASLADGFGIYNPDQKEEAMRAPDIVNTFRKTLAGPVTEPWFTWVHFLDPHSPYDLWKDYDFGSTIEDAYDSDIAYTDAHVGMILDELKARGLSDRTIVVLFSDHGEEFGEHGGRMHDSSVYEEQIHVPLVIHVPGLEPRKVEAAVGLMDLLPTTLHLVREKDGMSRLGRSLTPLMTDVAADRDGAVYAEKFRIQGRREIDSQRAVISGTKKLIRRVQRDLTEIYDLARDPHETRNLVGDDPALEARLLGLLEAFENRIARGRGGAATAVAPTSRPVRDEILASIDRLLDADPAIAGRAQSEISRRLWNLIGRPTPEAIYGLGESGQDEVAERIEALWPRTKDVAERRRIAGLLEDACRPRSVPFFYERLKELRSAQEAGQAACALARLGNRAGFDLLQALLTIPGAPDDREVAIALARLGAPEALPWIEPVLVGPHWRLAGRMVEALPFSGAPDVGRMLRDFVVEKAIDQKAVITTIATVLGEFPKDIEARHLLLRFAFDGDPAIREAALSALEKSGVSRDLIRAEEEAIVLELDGDEAAANRRFDLAALRWESALAKSKERNDGLRLRFARCLHLDGRTVEAARLLDDVKKNGVNERDRRIAARRTAMLDRPARLTDAGRFRATLEPFDLPEGTNGSSAFFVPVTIQNGGQDPWQGGPWRHSITLTVRFRDEAGTLLESRYPPINYLPDEGVLPGEVVHLKLLAVYPDVHGTKARAVVVFAQPWFDAIPDGGVIGTATSVTVLE